MKKFLQLQLQQLGSEVLSFLGAIGAATIMLVNAIAKIPDFKSGGMRLVRQIYFIGVLSLIITVLSGIFIGMVLSLQGHTILVKFGAEHALGQLIALSLVRELGPVVSALLFAGRAGTAITAEIGLMKASEQLSSLEMMAIDPLHRIVAPRFWAGQIVMPLLAIIFSAVAIMGGYIVGVEWLHVDVGAFWSNMQHSVDFSKDIVNGIIKSIFFGTVVSWIAVYQGMSCMPTAEGVGLATTRTVVYSSLSILGLDFFLTAIMFGA